MILSKVKHASTKKIAIGKQSPLLQAHNQKIFRNGLIHTNQRSKGIHQQEFKNLHSRADFVTNHRKYPRGVTVPHTYLSNNRFLLS